MEQSVLAFLRKNRGASDMVLVVCNFTPVPRYGYRLGVPRDGNWTILLNSDAAEFGGSGVENSPALSAKPQTWHGRPFSIELALPPLATVLLRSQAEAEA